MNWVGGSKSELDYDDDQFAPFGDDDDPAEVDAAFRMVRRIAVGYFVLFVVATLGVGVSLILLRWASTASIFGGFTPGFAVAGFGLYLFFVILGVASSSLINGVEDRMLGAQALEQGRTKT